MATKTIKLHPGFYELRGVTHRRPKYPGSPACGGKILAQRFPGEEDDDGRIPPSWECFCEECGECDPNGWPTLRECVENTPDYWT